MALFKKQKNEKVREKEPEVQQSAEQPKKREVKRTALTSGRMAGLYQKLYRWIFSVNISMDVYQIESGEDSLAGRQLPIRGYYRDLYAALSENVIEDQRAAFRELFGAESLSGAMRDGRTCLGGVFCAADFGRESPEEENGPDFGETAWYEFRAEWDRDVNLNNMVFIFSVRHVSSDLDTGAGKKESGSDVKTDGNGETDWDYTRAMAFNASRNGITFEYDALNDCMYVHRTVGSSDGDRVTSNFLKNITSRADYMVSHESISSLREALRTDAGRGILEREILYRKGGVYGAPFNHYRLRTAPVHEDTGIRWIVGMLDNIEEESAERRRNGEIASEISSMLDVFKVKIYQINVTQKLIFNIVQDETGFHREEKPQNLEEYIKRRVANGRIAPEYQDEYLRWLESEYLHRKTGKGPYEFEAMIKDVGDVDYRWYTETITAIKNMPGHFLRWRRDDTEGHRERDMLYQSKEQEHLTEYNGEMLDTLAGLVEFRNVGNYEHIAHVRDITRILLEDIQKRSPQYEVTKRDVALYAQAAAMHDIGKITIPDYILNKEGRYTPEEFEIMKKHTTSGAEIVESLNLPGQERLKEIIKDVARHHHERYDGNGYPDNLEGDSINIGVQAVSMADVYDALVSERCYKKDYGFEESMNMILGGECGVFNPCIIESLKACEPMLQKLYISKN
jgi:HD-GYP domain-containing protein (c-di-GMP phosphodiesterase class II)